jgi:hypothetical protein
VPAVRRSHSAFWRVAKRRTGSESSREERAFGATNADGMERRVWLVLVVA